MEPIVMLGEMGFIYLVIPMKDKPQIITAAIANTMFAEVTKLMSAGAVCTIESLLPTVTATIATARLAAVERSEWNPLSCWAKWDFIYLVIPMKDKPQIITAAIANRCLQRLPNSYQPGQSALSRACFRLLQLQLPLPGLQQLKERMEPVVMLGEMGFQISGYTDEGYTPDYHRCYCQYDVCRGYQTHVSRGSLHHQEVA